MCHREPRGLATSRSILERRIRAGRSDDKALRGKSAFPHTADDLRAAFWSSMARWWRSIWSRTGKRVSRGFAFVEMEEGPTRRHRGHERADFEGRALVVNEARPREERPRGAAAAAVDTVAAEEAAAVVDPAAAGGQAGVAVSSGGGWRRWRRRRLRWRRRWIWVAEEAVAVAAAVVRGGRGGGRGGGGYDRGGRRWPRRSVLRSPADSLRTSDQKTTKARQFMAAGLLF